MVLNPGKRRRKHKELVVHTAVDPDLGSLDYGLDVVCISMHFFNSSSLGDFFRIQTQSPSSQQLNVFLYTLNYLRSLVSH